MAEPLMVKVEGNASFVYIRLIDAYEAILKAAGVIFYYFHIPDDYKKYREYVERLGVSSIGRSETGTWYRRSLTDAAQATAA